MKSLPLRDHEVRALLSAGSVLLVRPVLEPRCAQLHGRHSVPERHFADPGLGSGGYLHWAYSGGDLEDDVCCERVYAPWYPDDEKRRVKEAWSLHGDGDVDYRATWPMANHLDEPEPRWQSSTSMPAGYERLVVEVESTRVVQLHALTEDEARSAGHAPTDCIPGWSVFTEDGRLYWTGREPVRGENRVRDYVPQDLGGTSARDVFSTHWQGSDGKRPGYSWADNPWCFAAMAKVVERR